MLALLFLISAAGATAQRKSKDTLVRFFNINLEPVPKREAVFAGVIVRDIQGWNCLIYDDSMRVLVRGKYADQDCKVKEGWFLYFYADGKRASGGLYTKNIRVDNWKTWHENGQLKDSVIYAMGTIHGPAKSYHENGNLSSEGQYAAGQFDGPWTFYHENGKPSTKELYKNKKLADLECFDSTGTSQGFNCAISRPPVIVGKYGGLDQYLQDSLRQVKRANGQLVEGFVSVQFVITKEGKMEDFRILRSEDPLLSQEVVRVIQSVKQWYPAVSHNRLIHYTVTMNIPFFENREQAEERFVPLLNPWDY